MGECISHLRGHDNIMVLEQFFDEYLIDKQERFFHSRFAINNPAASFKGNMTQKDLNYFYPSASQDVFSIIEVIMKSALIIVCFLLILHAGLASAEETKAGFVKSVSGQAFINRKQISIPAKIGDKLFETDTIITGSDGKIGIIFQDNSVLGIGSNTHVNISKFVFEPANKKLAFLVKIKKGSLVYLAGLMAKLENKNVKIETPTSVCGLRGTHLAIKVEAGEVKD